MKLTIFLLLLSVISVFANKTYSQNKLLTISTKSGTVKEVLQNIEDQSEFVFMYSEKLINVNREVSLDINNKKINEVLDILFKGTEVSYKIKDRFILLSTPEVYGNILVNQQQRSVAGTVTNEAGQPLPGVTVVVKGTTHGTVTDSDGKYSLSGISDDATLVFSFVGMQTLESVVGNQSTINVRMQVDAIGIEEVVAIGYGTQKKRDITTSIASVDAEELDETPVSDLTQALQGKMAGVRIVNNNSAPGGGSKIVIRGISSINASNSPLIVIDGFPLKDEYDKDENPFNFVNPADVASIEVLKDASSSAIYGTQAANGVILITTKKGKKGKPTINLDVSTGVQQMINPIDVLDSEDFVKFLEDSRSNSYLVRDPNLGSDDPNAPLWSYYDPYDLRMQNWDTYTAFAGRIFKPGDKLYRWFTVSDEIYEAAEKNNTDWQDVITRLGAVNNIQLSASGGTENVSYRISGGFFDQKGIVYNSDYNRFSFRSNIDLKINDWFNVGLLLAPSLENITAVANDENTDYSNPFWNAIGLPPVLAPRNEEGDPTYVGKVADGPWDWNFSFFINPLSLLEIQDERRIFKNLSTLYGEATIAKNLSLRSEFHTEVRHRERNYFYPSYVPTRTQRSSRSEGIAQNNSRLYWNSQNILSYNGEWEKHSLTAMAGYSIEETSYKTSYMKKYDFPTDLISTLNQATTVENAQSDVYTRESSESLIGSFGRFMYNYAGKYYLTASVRRDGSSKFGKDTRWGVFPSLSGAWRISDEFFFQPLKEYINDFKIRVGWGKIGNAGIPNYLALNTLSASTYVLGPGADVSPVYVDGKVSNSNLGWETTTDLNIGGDIQFFDSRIMLSVDYFDRVTDDMLFDMPLPDITGFDSYTANIGSMQNRGFEWALNTRNFVNQFKWTTNFNISYYRNKVLDIGKDKRPLIQNGAYTSEGHPLALLYNAVYLGPYKDWEDVKTSPIVHPERSSWYRRSIPGTVKNADVNGDGVIDGSDNTIIGNPTPDFVWGMTNNLSYKQFDLSVHINAVQGGDIYMRNMDRINGGNAAGSFNTNYEYFNNYWRPDRTDAKYAAPFRKNYADGDDDGALVVDGSYVNIQNVVLGYTAPNRIAQAVNFSTLRIYLSIQNALFITDFQGYNPEGNERGDSALSQTTTKTGYPLARTTSLGLKLSF